MLAPLKTIVSVTGLALDRVRAVAGVPDEGVVPGAAEEDVVVSPAKDQVVAVTAGDRVGAEAAIDLQPHPVGSQRGVVDGVRPVLAVERQQIAGLIDEEDFYQRVQPGDGDPATITRGAERVVSGSCRSP